ncbi:MAG TPA: DUF5522 domain-containing protein [Acidimicrobiales bacterium]
MGPSGEGEQGRPPPPHRDRLDPDRSDYRAILEAHAAAVANGGAGYADPETGLFVLTAATLRARGSCCESGCRHCPYLDRTN